jgi:hypothetical protein
MLLAHAVQEDGGRGRTRLLVFVPQAEEGWREVLLLAEAVLPADANVSIDIEASVH